MATRNPGIRNLFIPRTALVLLNGVLVVWTVSDQFANPAGAHLLRLQIGGADVTVLHASAGQVRLVQ
ncbi:MAG: hypothetical protein WDA11_02600 [Thiohalomonadaceae bacterium]